MRTGIFLLLLGSSLLLQPASADEVTIPGHMPTEHEMAMPRRGSSMDDVLSQFGEPRERKGPVGEPPITEWVYNGFAVYFEDQTVLHSIDLNTLIMPK